METDCKQPMRIRRKRALNGCVGRLFGPPHGTIIRTLIIKVTIMQIPGTGANRTQIPPSKPKGEIAEITNSQNIEMKRYQGTRIMKNVCKQPLRIGGISLKNAKAVVGLVKIENGGVRASSEGSEFGK